MPKQRSVMSHKFSEVPKANIERSRFDRSFGYKTTLDAGWLIPFYVDEALPGDTFNMRTAAFMRLATPLKPIMDNMIVDTFFFAVPNRILWNNWKKFNGEQVDPGDSIDFTIPRFVSLEASDLVLGSLSDYMGLPIAVGSAGNTIIFNSLHHRAYNLIWNEWFRDQNMQDSVVVDLDDGPDTLTDYVLLRRGKRHDYFTSCLPWPQKGATVPLPLGTLAPVIGLGMGGQAFAESSQAVFETGGADTYPFAADVTDDTGAEVLYVQGSAATGGLPLIYADLSNATAASINELRQSFQIQKMLERDARGGTRYTEIIKAHFGVTSPDARLQRPEFLGGGSSPVNIHPVPNMSDTATVNQGDLAGYGTASFSGHGFTKSFTEHCVLIGLVCVRADLTYQQGLDRMFSRQTRYDFYWPALAHIGEQAVLHQEIRASGVTLVDDVVFGYQERYAEYRYKQSKITGLFRSNAAGSLDMWHLSQELGTPVTLNAAFIVENPPIDRVIAVPTEPHFLFDSFSSLKCARPMPVYGVPGFIDHF